MPRRPVVPSRRRRRTAAAPRTGDRSARRTPLLGDRFFRQIVNSMRNGVIAIHRDGTVALMNDEAYRIFSLTPQPSDLGLRQSRQVELVADMIHGCRQVFFGIDQRAVEIEDENRAHRVIITSGNRDI